MADNLDFLSRTISEPVNYRRKILRWKSFLVSDSVFSKSEPIFLSPFFPLLLLYYAVFIIYYTVYCQAINEQLKTLQLFNFFYLIREIFLTIGVL